MIDTRWIVLPRTQVALYLRSPKELIRAFSKRNWAVRWGWVGLLVTKAALQNSWGVRDRWSNFHLKNKISQCISVTLPSLWIWHVMANFSVCHRLAVLWKQTLLVSHDQFVLICSQDPVTLLRTEIPVFHDLSHVLLPVSANPLGVTSKIILQPTTSSYYLYCPELNSCLTTDFLNGFSATVLLP